MAEITSLENIPLNSTIKLEGSESGLNDSPPTGYFLAMFNEEVTAMLSNNMSKEENNLDRLDFSVANDFLTIGSVEENHVGDKDLFIEVDESLVKEKKTETQDFDDTDVNNLINDESDSLVLSDLSVSHLNLFNSQKEVENKSLKLEIEPDKLSTINELNDSIAVNHTERNLLSEEQTPKLEKIDVADDVLNKKQKIIKKIDLELQLGKNQNLNEVNENSVVLEGKNLKKVSKEFIPVETMEKKVFSVSELVPQIKKEEPKELNVPSQILSQPVKGVLDKPVVNQNIEIDSPVNKVFEQENIERLSDSISYEMTNLSEKESSHFKLTLRPESLGDLDIVLDVKDGKLSAKFLVETDKVKELIQSNLTSLQESLSKHNIVLSKSEVSLNLSNNNFSSFEGDLNHRQNQQQEKYGDSGKFAQQYQVKNEYEENNQVNITDSVDILV